MGNINQWYRHEGERIESTGKIYFMTITDVATGETDPWGINLQVMFSAEGTEVNSTSTIEDFVNSRNDYVYSTRFNGYEATMIRTWETLKYYDDIFVPQTEFEMH